MSHFPSTAERKNTVFSLKQFAIVCLVVSIWVNASEIFRYFVFVMPMTREALAAIPDVAPMNLPVFAIWGVWDTLLVVMTVLMYWLYAAQFGATLRSSIVAGTLSWLFFFVLFWIGLYNMRLAKLDVLAIALPLAWIELVIASIIAKWGFARFTE